MQNVLEKIRAKKKESEKTPYKIKDTEKTSKKSEKTPKEIELEKSNLTDKELFNNLFDDNKKTDSLVHWLNILDGNCNEIKILKEEYFSKAIESLSNYSGGLTMFYTVEDVYFLEYKTLTIVLIIGNDE